MHSMLQSNRTNSSLDIYHRFKHVDFPLLYRMFFSISPIPLESFLHVSADMTQPFYVSLFITFQHNLPNFVITF